MATVIATQTVRVAAAGHRSMVVKGKPYDTSDPVVKGNRWLFVDADEYARGESRPQTTAELGARSMSARKRTVEQATAAPGEQRNATYACGVDGCDFSSTSERGLKIHKGSQH